MNFGTVTSIAMTMELEAQETTIVLIAVLNLWLIKVVNISTTMKITQNAMSVPVMNLVIAQPVPMFIE